METTITLTEAEMRIAKHVVLQRQKEDETNKVACRSSIPEPARMEVAYHSYCAELAVCRALNVYPGLTWSVEDIPNPDGRYRDVSIDVKYSRRTTNLNYHKKHRKNPAWVFILALGTAPEFTMMGWLPRGAIMQDRYFVPERRINGKKYWEHWSVPHNELWPMDTLDLWIDKWA